MQENQHVPQPAPTPLCAIYALRLALLGSDSLEPEAAAETRAHLATCAWCRAKLATFEVVDAALVRHFGAAQPAMPRITLEEIISDDDGAPAESDEWILTQPRGQRRRRGSALLAIACTIALVVAAGVIFSALPRGTGGSSTTLTPAPSATSLPISPTIAPTATPLSACGLLTGAGALYQSVMGVPGLRLPAGAYISADSVSGGGVGRYTVHSYTACFHGSEAEINGDAYAPGTAPTSSLGMLVAAGWSTSNLFPRDLDFAGLDHCSGSRLCLNDTGTPNPFTFLAVDQFFTRTDGNTTFRLQVAIIAAPTCLNDPLYYSGTPQYSLYEQGNNPTDATYFFFMPPATRISGHRGSGAAGSFYSYFCSAGSSATILNFLEEAMQEDGWSISVVSGSDFIATKGGSPQYRVEVNTANPENYSLHIFSPS